MWIYIDATLVPLWANIRPFGVLYEGLWGMWTSYVEAHMREKGSQWLVTLWLVHHWARRQVSPTSLAFGKSSSLAIFANFWSFFAIFTLFGAFSLCTVGAFLTIFPIFLGFVGILWGTPAIYFADFGGNFGHFWPLLGPKNWLFLPENAKKPQV